MNHLSPILIIATLVGGVSAPTIARAQATSKVISACGSATYGVGTPQYATMDPTGVACTAGSASAAPTNVIITPSSAAGAAIAPTPSASAESCHTYKITAGNGYSFSGYVGAAAWIMLFDATTPPGDGAVTPAVWAYAPAAGSWSISYGSIPARFSTGIVACASSTGPLTKTAFATNTVFSGRFQ